MKTVTKKISAIFLLLTLILSLCGCGHRHTWQEATCTEPRTCAECGESEGDPLGHDWADPTCSEPRTCRRCGLTEGEPLGHQPTEPDYWHAGVCQRCGEEVLPKWTPELEAYGVDCFVAQGVDAVINTECRENASVDTALHFRVTDWGVTNASTAGFVERSGYECLYVTYDASFTDANAERWGARFLTVFDDYYDSTLANNTLVGNFYAEGVTYEVPWNASRWHVWARGEVVLEELTGNARICHVTFYFQVPEGYDGVVVGVTRPHYNLPNEYLYTYAHEDTILFRLAN